MAETSVAALEPRLQKQVESARIAYGRGNFDFTINLCRAVLRERPDCPSVRGLHRMAALRLHQGSGAPFVVSFGRLSNVPLLLRPDDPPETEPRQVVEKSEMILEDDPHNTEALRQLGQAAAALGWKETAVYAYAAIREEAPRDGENLLALGGAQLAAGRAEEAAATAEEALLLEPENARARDLLKGASAAQIIQVGRWEEGGGIQGRMRG